ncbi:MAG: InlB B-repeat-containing protein [Bacteroides sp.]|nr:InlB B-repeat-containing protein [Bacteroides sp.]
MTELDLSGCTALTDVQCYGNDLTSLDLSGCAALTDVQCYGNDLTSLDLSGCAALKDLGGYVDYYGSVSLLKADTLKIHGAAMDTLRLSHYDIKVLDASGCTSLRKVYDTANEKRLGMEKINLHKCTGLTSIELQDDKVLTELICDSAQLAHIELLGCTSLPNLNCAYSKLEYLSVSDCPALTQLDCSHSRLRHLSVSDCAALADLNCAYGSIPLSEIYAVYTMRSRWDNFQADHQYDSIRMSTNQSLNLSGERVIGGSASTYELLDSRGETVPSAYYTDNGGFVFSFHEPIQYTLIVKNRELKTESFTWHISVGNEVLLRVSSNNTAWGTASITGNGSYVEGTEVTITAVPNEGYRFVNWTKAGGGLFSTEPTYTFTATENLELTANFEERPAEFTVSVSVNEADWGTASISGDGTYEENEEVTITAVPEDGYRFVNWTKEDGSVFSTKANYMFEVTESLALTANFKKRAAQTENFTVSVSANNAAWGTASVSGDGTYEENEEVTITAVPEEGYRFVNWTEEDGSVFSTKANYMFEVTENLALTANFAKEGGVANENTEGDNFYVYTDGRTIHLSSGVEPVRVYNAAGICVYGGHATAIPVSHGGLYIVRVGQKSYKVMVR